MLAVFLDIETNGLDPYRHRILEVALQLLDILSGQRLAMFTTVVQLQEREWARSDPTSLQVHGLTYPEVQRGATPLHAGQQLLQIFAHHRIERGRAVFVCHNPSFDRPFFSQLISVETQEQRNFPYHWLDLASMFWAKHLFTQPPSLPQGLTKNQIAAAVGLPPEANPHRAMQGVEHLIACYRRIVGFPDSISPTPPNAAALGNGEKQLLSS